MNNDTLQTLLDRQAITDKLHHYCRAMDRIDDDLGRSVFHPDAQADYGEMYQGSGHGFIDFVHQAHLGMLVHQHALSNILIDLQGDRAGSEAYVTVTFRIRNADDSLTGMRSHGRYVDRWERRDGVWGIVHRHYVHDMDESWSTEMAFTPQGHRDSNDPSYSVLS